MGLLSKKIVMIKSSIGLIGALLIFVHCQSKQNTEPEAPQLIAEISSPSADAKIARGDSVVIQAIVSTDGADVAYVEFSVDREVEFHDDQPPYSFTWHTEEAVYGNHRLGIKAVDHAGNVEKDEISVSVVYVYQQPAQISGSWPVSTMESEGMDEKPIEELMNILLTHPDHRTHGILIARHGALVFEAYFPGYRRDSQNILINFSHNVVHDLASSTKSVTSALLGIAIDQGFISDVSTPLHTYYPDMIDSSDTLKRQITLEHLITMSPGIQWDQHSASPLDPQNDLIQFASSSDPWSFYLSRPMTSSPGTVMNYSEASINVVGECIRMRSGSRLDKFADTYLFGPLGITNRVWKTIRGDWVWCSGDLFLWPRDMLKIGELYLRGGLWNNQQVISQSWIQRTLQPYFVIDESFAEHEKLWAETADMTGYSYAWWTLDPGTYGENAITANGWGDQRIMVLPDYDLVVVFTGGSQWEPPLKTSHEMMMNYIIPSIVDE